VSSSIEGFNIASGWLNIAEWFIIASEGFNITGEWFKIVVQYSIAGGWFHKSVWQCGRGTVRRRTSETEAVGQRGKLDSGEVQQ
jgi:hypothetical protein